MTTLDVLEHIDDDRGMLAEMHRVLAPGGTLLVTVPAFPFLWGPRTRSPTTSVATGGASCAPGSPQPASSCGSLS